MQGALVRTYRNIALSSLANNIPGMLNARVAAAKYEGIPSPSSTCTQQIPARIAVKQSKYRSPTNVLTSIIIMMSAPKNNPNASASMTLNIMAILFFLFLWLYHY